MVPGGALTLVVLLEQAVAQVVAVVAPHGVDVVAVVDRVVELDEELRALDPVVVRLAALGSAGPAEVEVRQAVAFDPVALPGREFLRHPVQVAGDELQQRVALAGLEIVEARISFLAYAPEIAHAMLQRQQAAAIIAARTKIVEGAVGMVESALAMLAQKGVVKLDEERKAQMVSNLLVVLCGDRSTQPVVNAGTIYS